MTRAHDQHAVVADRAWLRYLAGESFVVAFRSEWRKAR